MRRTLVQMMRALADLGHNSMLPDLPGQNDSNVDSDKVTLADWRAALSDIAYRENAPLIVASWRGGALIDDAVSTAKGYWRMAPTSGASIIKTMIRTRIAGEREAGRHVSSEELRAEFAATGFAELAGNRFNIAMLEQLEAAKAAAITPLRQVQPGVGEGKVEGSALWLRAEPGEDSAMAIAMAQDLAKWAATCAAG